MSKILSILSLLFFGVFFSSCIRYEILIKNDNTANVNVKLSTTESNLPANSLSNHDDYENTDRQELIDEIINFYSSEQIQNFRFDTLSSNLLSQSISYDVITLDSIGSFIDPVFGTYIDFKRLSDGIEINGPAGIKDPEDDPTGFLNLLDFEVVLKFESPFKSIETNNEYVTTEDDRTLLIKTNYGNLLYNEVPFRVLIMF